MSCGRIGSLDLNEALCTNRLITTSSMNEGWRVVEEANWAVKCDSFVEMDKFLLVGREQTCSDPQ